MKCLFSSVLLSLLLLAAVDAITDTTVLSTSSLTTQTTTPHPAFDCQNNNPCGTVEGQFFFRHIISQLYIQCGVGTSCFERSCKTGFDWDQSTLSCKKSNYTESWFLLFIRCKYILINLSAYKMHLIFVLKSNFFLWNEEHEYNLLQLVNISFKLPNSLIIHFLKLKLKHISSLFQFLNNFLKLNSHLIFSKYIETHNRGHHGRRQLEFCFKSALRSIIACSFGSDISTPTFPLLLHLLTTST